jgi:hypothetical protein
VKFRKKSVVVEIVPIREVLAGSELLPAWVQKALATKMLTVKRDENCVAIQTLEGSMIGGADDHLIKGVHGELYAITPEALEATYEPVPEGT